MHSGQLCNVYGLFIRFIPNAPFLLFRNILAEISNQNRIYW